MVSTVTTFYRLVVILPGPNDTNSPSSVVTLPDVMVDQTVVAGEVVVVLYFVTLPGNFVSTIVVVDVMTLTFVWAGSVL